MEWRTSTELPALIASIEPEQHDPGRGTGLMCIYAQETHQPMFAMAHSVFDDLRHECTSCEELGCMMKGLRRSRHQAEEIGRREPVVERR